MKTPLSGKSSVEEIRQRFDADVERFSRLDTGQEATIDAPLAMDLISRAAVATTPRIARVLDLGCGAGNQTLRLLMECPDGFACELCDLSLPMLERARERIAAQGAEEITIHPGDFRRMGWPDARYDVVIAAAVLHHLRDDADWETAFGMIFRILNPGGSFWVWDLVAHEDPGVRELMWGRYAAYLEGLGGIAYRRKVFDRIDREDSPRSLVYQLELMRKVGFRTVEVLHKTACFAAFGAIKGVRER